MLISTVFKWCLVFFTILNTCSSLAMAKETVEGEERKHLYKRNVERQRMRRNRNWASFRRHNSNQSSWLSFTPPTPNPDEVDCHIEVEVRRRVDGRCVRLGGQFQTAVCQSGMHLDFFHNDCETTLAQREAGLTAGVTSQSNPAQSHHAQSHPDASGDQ